MKIILFEPRFYNYPYIIFPYDFVSDILFAVFDKFIIHLL